MNNKRDGFSGFLDGYKAQNLANVADSASIQIKQMQETAKNIQKKYAIDKLSSSLLDNILTMSFTSQSLTTVGEGIKTLIIKDIAEATGLHGDNEFKMLVLNYMSIVQLYGDNKIIDIALEVGDLLNN
jgi:hypothetical protein